MIEKHQKLTWSCKARDCNAEHRTKKTAENCFKILPEIKNITKNYWSCGASDCDIKHAFEAAARHCSKLLQHQDREVVWRARFNELCLRLKEDGKTTKQMAILTNVSITTFNNYTERAQRERNYYLNFAARGEKVETPKWMKLPPIEKSRFSYQYLEYLQSKQNEQA